MLHINLPPMCIAVAVSNRFSFACNGFIIAHGAMKVNRFVMIFTDDSVRIRSNSGLLLLSVTNCTRHKESPPSKYRRFLGSCSVGRVCLFNDHLFTIHVPFFVEPCLVIRPASFNFFICLSTWRRVNLTFSAISLKVR